jgi:signal transduction histidine kinase
MYKNSLTEKLIIYFMLLSIGAISIVGVYSYLSARKAQMARTYDQLASVRYLKKKQVEAFYNDRIIEVQSISSDPLLQLFLLGKSNQAGLQPSISPFLSKILYSHSFCRGLIVFNKGISLYVDMSDGNHFRNNISWTNRKTDSLLMLAVKNGRPVISDLLKDGQGPGWFQLIIAPVEIQDSSQFAAVAMQMTTAALDSIMLDPNPLNGLGKSGEAYLTGKDRFLRSSSRFSVNAILKSRIDTSTSRLAFEGNNGYWLQKDYRGVEVLGSSTKLSSPCPDWAVIAEIDTKEAMVPIISIRNNILFISVFITMIAFFTTWLLSRKLSMPLIKLQKAVQELGKGKLGMQVEIITNDEIGELAKSFNVMSEQLKEKDLQLNNERARRMRAAFDGQDTERQRLSRELHDGLGQSLIAQKLRLESFGLPEKGKTNALLDEMKQCSDKLVDEVRRISNDLMPAQLTQFGIVPALRQQCDEVSRLSGIEISFESTGSFDAIRRKSKIYLFRIIQEALNNIVKHAESTSAAVEIVNTREHIFVSISDNGIGFDTEKPCKGNGLNNMRERAQLLGGTISITSQPGKGSTIEIQIPSNG